MTEIYLIDSSVLEDERVFQKGLHMVSAKRAEKIKQFKNPAVARLSLGAGVLLVIALEKQERKESLDMISFGEYGKPFFPNANFHFSLSHSGEYALCAVSDVPIGVDLQKIKEKIPANTKKILSKEEEQYLQRCANAQKIELFYRLWARKESLIKWDGRGLRLPLSEISFVQNGALQEELLFEGKKVFFQEYLDVSGYAVCVCKENLDFPTKIEEMTEYINKILNV